MVFMYTFGDCRSVTLLPCASRSRSRSRIFSRSNATAFMRVDSVSFANSGIAKRQHRRAGRDCGEQHGEKLRFEVMFEELIHARNFRNRS